MARTRDFSLRALYEALDEQRKVRGLSWAEATRQMNGQAGVSKRHVASKGHSLSASTVKAMRIRTVAEGDGVLQMLRWLDRTPESFLPNYDSASARDADFPDVPSGGVLRFDTKKLYGAVNARRQESDMTWQDAAKQIGVAAAGLQHLSKGGRTSFPQVMRILRWLGRRAADFTRVAEH